MKIVSDRGPQFTSQVWKAFCSALPWSASIFRILSSVQWPNRETLESALCCITTQNPATWSSHLPWVEYAHNSLTSSATGLLPFEASLGYWPLLFPEVETDLAVYSGPTHLDLDQGGSSVPLHRTIKISYLLPGMSQNKRYGSPPKTFLWNHFPLNLLHVASVNIRDWMCPHSCGS